MQAFLDLFATAFKPLGDTKLLSQCLDWLVEQEARSVGRKLEEYTTGFAEVDRVKVDTVEHRRHAETFLDLGPPFEVRCVVLCTEGDVVHASRAEVAVAGLRVNEQIDVVAAGIPLCGEALTIALLSDLVE